jgi:hypothetical protein
MTQPAFRPPLTQLENVIRLRYPFVRIIRQHRRRPRPGLQRLRAMAKRLCRPFFRGSTPLFWLVLAYRQVALPAWSRIRVKLLDVGRLTGRRVFRPDQPHAPFRERFEVWAEKSRCPCRETGHDWREYCDEPGQWTCVRCKQETTCRGQPPSHRFLSSVPHALGIERYREWRRRLQH